MASWRDGHEDVKANSSKARKLRRKFYGTTATSIDVIEGQAYEGDDRTRVLSSLARLKSKYVEPTYTRIGRAVGPLAAGVELDYDVLPTLLYELEDEALHRMGNRTYYDPEKLKEKIDEFGNVNYSPNPMRLITAVARVSEKLKYVNVSPLSYEDALSVMLTRQKSTSAGFPWYASRSAVCYKYLPLSWRALNPELDEKAFAASEKVGIDIDPIADAKTGRTPVYTANFRTESGADGAHKTRLVWSAPLGNQIHESRYAIPFQELMKNEDEEGDRRNGSMFMYFSEYRQMQVIRNMIGYAQEHKLDLISADYSSFDATIHRQLIEYAFAIIGVDGTNFVTKKLLSPWGVKTFTNGVPSGSPFTNIIDSIVNAIILEYIAVSHEAECAYRVNGDDSVVIFSGYISSSDIAESALELGIEMNPSKQARSRNSCTFNRQYWGLEYGGPVPSINRTLNSLVYRDKPYEGVGKTVADECLRDTQVLLRLESHPLVDKFLQRLLNVLGEDRYLLDYRHWLPQSKYLPMEGGSPVSSEEYVKFLDKTFLSQIYD